MIELLRTRRSIRKYADKAVTSAQSALLQEALLRSPSSRDNTPWEFIFVENRETLRTLSRCKPSGAEFLKSAPLAIAVCGDERKSDVWVENCSIACIVVQLAAHSLGLGSCWIQIRNREHDATKSAEHFIQELLAIPGYLRVEALISVGWPAEEKEARPRETLDYGKIKFETYTSS